MSEGPIPPPSDPTPPLNYQAPSGGYLGPVPEKEVRTLGMLCHLLALAGLLIPLGSILGPLVIWLLKKDSHPFIDDQGKESLNFQITVLIALIISGLMIFVLIGFVLLPVVGILDVVFVIIATIKANDGVAYRYPFALRLIK